MKKENDWRERLNVVYSTNPDFQYAISGEAIPETLPPAKQQLRIELDKRNRKGKSVTLITGFVGSETDLAELARTLKTKCGIGGSSKGGEILLQGDFRKAAGDFLRAAGYKVKVIGL